MMIMMMMMMALGWVVLYNHYSIGGGGGGDNEGDGGGSVGDVGGKGRSFDGFQNRRLQKRSFRPSSVVLPDSTPFECRLRRRPCPGGPRGQGRHRLLGGHAGSRSSFSPFWSLAWSSELASKVALQCLLQHTSSRAGWLVDITDTSKMNGEKENG